jgi:cytochrome c oxidase subunit IV
MCVKLWILDETVAIFKKESYLVAIFKKESYLVAIFKKESYFRWMLIKDKLMFAIIDVQRGLVWRGVAIC